MPMMCLPLGQLTFACENSSESDGLEEVTRWSPAGAGAHTA